MAQGGPRTRVELRLSCRNLKDKDVLSKSDPMVVLYIQNRFKSSTWDEVCAYRGVLDQVHVLLGLFVFICFELTRALFARLESKVRITFANILFMPWYSAPPATPVSRDTIVYAGVYEGEIPTPLEEGCCGLTIIYIYIHGASLVFACTQSVQCGFYRSGSQEKLEF